MAANKKIRLELIDSIRGLAIVNMIAFHACFIMNVFNLLISGELLFGRSFTIWERFICTTFIFISGFAFNLSKNQLKNGLKILGTGIMITVVTVTLLYDLRIIFGVLCVLGLSQLIMIPLDKLMTKHIKDKKIYLGLFIIVLFIVIMTWNINKGYLGIGNLVTIMLPETLYQKGYVMTFIGFTSRGFYSTDYFSFLPWFFVYMLGYIMHKLIKDTVIEKRYLIKGVPFLRTIGKHSLIIYIIHPVVLFVAIFAISLFVNK